MSRPMVFALSICGLILVAAYAYAWFRWPSTGRLGRRAFLFVFVPASSVTCAALVPMMSMAAPSKWLIIPWLGGSIASLVAFGLFLDDWDWVAGPHDGYTRHGKRPRFQRRSKESSQ